MSTKTRFEKEAKGNSEMVYCSLYARTRYHSTYLQPKQIVHIPVFTAKKLMSSKTDHKKIRVILHKQNIPGSVADIKAPNRRHSKKLKSLMWLGINLM